LGCWNKEFKESYLIRDREAGNLFQIETHYEKMTFIKEIKGVETPGHLVSVPI
jgi:hypothetical protein